ncbi:MAG: hypothetical protein LC745_09920, partial [Planctomycetia bacterium]|nr:hypothetical protein [Planctomycetia bacterium]
PGTVYFRGETVKGKVSARYQYGTPLANRPFNLSLPDGRTLHATTDAAGSYAFEFETAGFAEAQALRITAHLPEENVAASAAVNVAVVSYTLGVRTNRDVYLDGEIFRVEATTRDVQGDPTGQSLSAALLKRVTQAERVTEKEVDRVDLKTDPKTGQGGVSLVVNDPDGGTYVVRVGGIDRFGNAVVADRVLTVSGKKDEMKLRILADRQDVKVGEEAAVRLHSRDAAGTALLTWEADRILRYKVVALKEGDNSLTWTVDDSQFPNFTLNAARMAGNRFDRARLDLKVKRDLVVTVSPAKRSVGPGEEVEVEVSTRDQLGRPVAAEVSLALVDRALLRLFHDNLPPIGPYFYGQTRTGAFATEATNTFRYQTASVPVPEAVVEEEERLASVVADAERLGEVRLGATHLLARSVSGDEAPPPAPAPSAAKAARPAMNQRPELDVDRKAGGRGRAEAFNRGPASGVEPAANIAGLAMAPAQMSDDVSRAKETGKPEGPPRQSFVETAYWNPAVVTAKDGKARVTFRAPTALSQYRFTARGVTGPDTLAGQTTADLAVRKDFFVDLKVPASLTQGDKPRLTARLHHAGLMGKATLTLKGYPGDLADARTVDVSADGAVEVAFDPFVVPDGDTVRFEVSAALGEARDTVAVEVPIRPWGVQAFAAASGTASD